MKEPIRLFLGLIYSSSAMRLSEIDGRVKTYAKKSPCNLKWYSTFAILDSQLKTISSAFDNVTLNAIFRYLLNTHTRITQPIYLVSRRSFISPQWTHHIIKLWSRTNASTSVAIARIKRKKVEEEHTKMGLRWINKMSSLRLFVHTFSLSFAKALTTTAMASASVHNSWSVCCLHVKVKITCIFNAIPCKKRNNRQAQYIPSKIIVHK